MQRRQPTSEDLLASAGEMSNRLANETKRRKSWPITDMTRSSWARAVPG